MPSSIPATALVVFYFSFWFICAPVAFPFPFMQTRCMGIEIIIPTRKNATWALTF